jgi:hydroxymethylglutaryl-CoA lyase
MRHEKKPFWLTHECLFTVKLYLFKRLELLEIRMGLPESSAVRIVEVGPRDGLQNVSTVVPTTTKLRLIERLYKTGLQTIEVTSVVSPRAVPQLSDSSMILGDAGVQKLLTVPELRLPVLVPNIKGFEIAWSYGVREIAVFVSASEGFSRANINCSVQEGLDRARMVAEAALNHGISVRG